MSPRHVADEDSVTETPSGAGGPATLAKTPSRIVPWTAESTGENPAVGAVIVTFFDVLIAPTAISPGCAVVVVRPELATV